MSPDVAVRTFPAMGGAVEVQLVSDGEASCSRVESTFARHESALSRFLPGSELCALNAHPDRPFRASPLLFDAVCEAVGWACVTDGVFDPTVLDALEAAGYDRTFEELPPRRAAILDRPALRTSRWRAVALDFERETITLPAGVRIDLGGIGKGYTVDRAIATLGAAANAMVNASGDLYAAGDGPDGDGWYVGVADPLDPERDIATLNVNDRGVATSGSTHRRWYAGDQRYHHLIDARAGCPSESDLLAVTVVAPTATQADVLAKTAFLLGSQAGLSAVQRFDGAECLAVTVRGETLDTSGMAEFYV